MLLIVFYSVGPNFGRNHAAHVSATLMAISLALLECYTPWCSRYDVEE